MGYGRNKTLAHPCDLPYKARTFVARVESDQSVPVRIQGPYINESTKEIIAPISIQNTFTHTHTLPMGEKLLLVHGAYASQVSRARAESYVAHSKGVFGHGSGRDITGYILGH